MKKFICDEMCAELGRWLRTAGYDTVIIDTPMPDKKILEKAVKEDRLLITRDRDFNGLDPEGNTVIYLKEEALDAWAKQLKDRGVDWLYQPFTRCLHCNSVLGKIPAPRDSIKGIPTDVTEFWACPTCGNIFWHGSHTERMENQLRAWQT